MITFFRSVKMDNNWTDLKTGHKSDNYTCPKCDFKHYSDKTMNIQVMTKYKSLPVHMFCPCGKDLGKLTIGC